MDIYCPNCGEPWDIDSLHDIVDDRFPNLALNKYQEKFSEVRSDFAKNGCAIFGVTCSKVSKSQKQKNSFMRELYELFDDDIEAAVDAIEYGKDAGVF